MPQPPQCLLRQEPVDRSHFRLRRMVSALDRGDIQVGIQRAPIDRLTGRDIDQAVERGSDWLKVGGRQGQAIRGGAVSLHMFHLHSQSIQRLIVRTPFVSSQPCCEEILHLFGIMFETRPKDGLLRDGSPVIVVNPPEVRVRAPFTLPLP